VAQRASRIARQAAAHLLNGRAAAFSGGGCGVGGVGVTVGGPSAQAHRRWRRATR